MSNNIADSQDTTSRKALDNQVDTLRESIERDWGEKCPDFCVGCYTCQIHRALETIESAYDLHAAELECSQDGYEFGIEDCIATLSNNEEQSNGSI